MNKEIGMLLVVIVLLIGLITFYGFCYGWLVAAFPTFTVFPKWAFITIMFLLTDQGCRQRD